MTELTLTAADLDNLVLNEYPYPIAVNYRRVLEAKRWETKTQKCIRVFEYGIRVLALGLVSQYLIRDREKVSSDQLNRLLSGKIKRATLGTWNELFFTALRAYERKRELFFMPELYDMYWDTSVKPHRQRLRVRQSFDRLVQIRNEIIHGVPPSHEEAWRGLFEEVFGHLRDVLSRFAFLQSYDLIHITEAEEEGYRYDVYTGQRVTLGQELLRTEQALGEGWFYLSKDRTKFLQLHPLFIYWDEETVEIAKVRRDAAIFDKFTWQQLTYLATVLGMAVPITDRTAIAEFVRLVFETVDEVKREREAVKQLTWWVLQRIAREISFDRMGDVREKRYHPEAYLQRELAKTAFEGFLSSDKVCLLVMGKSGVGKSSFIFSLADAYADDPYVCALLYNGARLSAELPVDATLTRDFELRLRLERRGNRKIEDILAEIHRIDGMEVRKVILFIDAINESLAAKDLLRRVDELVETTPYKWLKVVMSCRPETWRTIKRGVRLADHKYYRQPERDELGLELEEFTREELPAAYGRYRQAFGLLTEYEALPVRVRQVLQDPLTLRLVAETYEGKEIPPDIKVSEVYQGYLETLLQTERLGREDIVFLERELMPLMIGTKGIDNVIAGSVIANAQTMDGRNLFDQIHSDDLLGSGRRVNQSYANLVDARILIEQGTELDYVIAFQYERFYEHFGGKRLFDALPTGDERAQAYLERIEDIAAKPYLWGVVRTALRIELEGGDPEVAKDVACRGGFLAQGVFLAALVEYGQDNHREACKLLDELYGSSEKGLIGWFRGWFRNKKRESNEQLEKVAVRGASQLSHISLLRQACLSSSPAIRAVAAQNVYYLWERQWREGRDENDGLNLLVDLSAGVKGSLGLPRLRVLEACAGISLQIVMDLVLFAESEDHRDGLATLARVWKGIFEGVLTAGRQYSGLCQSAASILRRIVLRLGTRVALHIMSVVERSYPASEFSIAELRDYFAAPRTSKRKQLIRKVAPYLLPEHGSLDEVRDELLALARERNFVPSVVLLAILIARVLHETRETLPVLQEVFEHAFSMSPPTPAVPQTILALGGIFLDKPAEVTLEQLQLFTNYISRFHERYRSRCRATNRWYQHSHINWYIPFYHQFYQSDDAPFIGRYLELAAAENDLASMAHFGRRMVSLAVELRRHGQAQRRAMWALCRAIWETPSELHDPILDAIGRIFVYFPDDVLDILDQAGLHELENGIRLRATPETLGDIIGGRVSWFARYTVLLHPDRSRLQRLIRLIIQTTEVNSLGAWLELALEELVDFISSI